MSVVLVAKRSGNNINVSCTIDKGNFLESTDKNLALKVQANNLLAGMGGRQKSPACAKPRPSVSLPTPVKRPNLEGHSSGAKHEGNEIQECVKCLSKPQHVTIRQNVDKTDGKTGHVRLGQLSEQNVATLTAERRIGASMRNQLIRTWVERVNAHIQSGRLEYDVLSTNKEVYRPVKKVDSSCEEAPPAERALSPQTPRRPKTTETKSPRLPVKPQKHVSIERHQHHHHHKVKVEETADRGGILGLGESPGSGGGWWQTTP